MRALISPFLPIELMLDPFERFAEDSGLRMTAEPLSVAPRDVLAALDGMEQHFLVTLARASTEAPPIRLIFLTPVAAGQEPSLRDVLWWIAGDAWVIEQGNGKLESWAATYGYPADAEGTSCLFEQAVRQAAALGRLLGDSDTHRLLALYEAEVGPSRAI